MCLWCWGVGRANVCVCVGGGGIVHACEGWVGCIDVCV